MALIIREACEADARTISNIEDICILSPWTYEMIKDELSLPHTLYLIAEDEGGAAGFIGASIMIDSADITNVAVLPEKRRMGAGRALVDAMIAELSKRGVTEVLLEVRAHGIPAIELYKGCGFEQISVRRNYYKDPTDDALIMRRDI